MTNIRRSNVTANLDSIIITRSVNKFHVTLQLILANSLPYFGLSS